MRKILTLASILLMSTGCAELFSDRSFSDQMDNSPDDMWVADEDFPVVPGDSGQAYRTRREILARTPASVGAAKKEKNNENLELELEAKLSKLSEREYSDFMANSRFLETDSEKIYYLDLPRGQRHQYVLDKKGKVGASYAGGTGIHYKELQNLRRPEITLGMSKDEVMQSWGRPSQVEIAGNPRYENERWLYEDSGRRGQVYFENGQVQGWTIR